MGVCRHRNNHCGLLIGFVLLTVVIVHVYGEKQDDREIKRDIPTKSINQHTVVRTKRWGWRRAWRRITCSWKKIWGQSVKWCNNCPKDWSYHGDQCGPDQWQNKYPDCGNVMQSPINIITSSAIPDPQLLPIDLREYGKSGDNVSFTLVNNGHSATVNLGAPHTISGGGMPTSYGLAQYHFHWGTLDTQGSEHTVDGGSFAMEMHLVHTQTTNIASSSKDPYGLAVISFLFEISSDDNPVLENIVQYLGDVVDEDEAGVVIPSFPLTDLLPPMQEGHLINYFRYFGSLTTPPCSETVIWTVAKEKINMSHRQLLKFRQLKDDEGRNVQDTYRPTQPMNDRPLFSTSG